MSEPRVEILFDDERLQFEPGDTLAGQFLVSVDDPQDLKAVELSVMWSTEGTGDEDLAVHHFERLDAGENGAVDLRRPVSFTTRLPNSPLSYHGLIVRINWCVRVRAYLTRGEPIVAEESFQLGAIPNAAQPTAPTV